MALDAADVGASITFATITITRPLPPRETAPDDPWATASPTRPAEPNGTSADAPAAEPPF
ncbi:hypothetical protein [Streptomyces sp. NBC_00233]|uniref:hypothetical protein n=1 Tax=Streptomyces sp. NBC_00233 TaxID=2975686 RepID=UPI002251171A|nr:hypothetical protein [Streptomyces sp. NBC_00233]MCX5233185.1 hypothetical protein [Streptomyces sp. NBC_00233]